MTNLSIIETHVANRAIKARSAQDAVDALENDNTLGIDLGTTQVKYDLESVDAEAVPAKCVPILERHYSSPAAQKRALWKCWKKAFNAI